MTVEYPAGLAEHTLVTARHRRRKPGSPQTVDCRTQLRDESLGHPRVPTAGARPDSPLVTGSPRGPGRRCYVRGLPFRPVRFMAIERERAEVEGDGTVASPSLGRSHGRRAAGGSPRMHGAGTARCNRRAPADPAGAAVPRRTAGLPAGRRSTAAVTRRIGQAVATATLVLIRKVATFDLSFRGPHAPVHHPHPMTVVAASTGKIGCLASTSRGAAS
jgi:hypothetical protein